LLLMLCKRVVALEDAGDAESVEVVKTPIRDPLICSGISISLFLGPRRKRALALFRHHAEFMLRINFEASSASSGCPHPLMLDTHLAQLTLDS
jgi:hypothetical protein